MKFLRHSGFTLLELLIVIAIIGLLASVIVVALNSSRGGAIDSVIQQNLSGIRTQALLYYEVRNGAYCVPTIAPPECDAGAITVGSCSVFNSIFTDNPNEELSVNPAITAAGYAYDSVNGGGSRCSMDLFGQLWSVDQLLRDGVTRWCVDSSGHFGVGADSNGDARCD